MYRTIRISHSKAEEGGRVMLLKKNGMELCARVHPLPIRQDDGKPWWRATTYLTDQATPDDYRIVDEREARSPGIMMDLAAEAMMRIAAQL